MAVLMSLWLAVSVCGCVSQGICKQPCYCWGVVGRDLGGGVVRPYVQGGDAVPTIVVKSVYKEGSVSFAYLLELPFSVCLFKIVWRHEFWHSGTFVIFVSS